VSLAEKKNHKCPAMRSVRKKPDADAEAFAWQGIHRRRVVA